ncbi:hypothetical protein H8E77_15790 [bacterium]|nr:hypothetical protein [bacterium]
MKTSGMVMTLIGGIGVLFSIITIVRDLGSVAVYKGMVGTYNYQPPLSSHELGMLFLLGLTVVLAIVGIILWVRGAKTEDSR